jgi:hypothetical protein
LSAPGDFISYCLVYFIPCFYNEEQSTSCFIILLLYLLLPKYINNRFYYNYRQLSSQKLTHETPIVHIDSEGSASRIAPNLHAFFISLLSLNAYLTAVIGYVGSGNEPYDSAPANGNGNDIENINYIGHTIGRIEKKKEKVISHMKRWREEDAMASATDKEDFASKEDILWLHLYIQEHLLSHLDPPLPSQPLVPLLSDEEAIDGIFQEDFYAEPRWRPRPMDDM